MAIEFNFEVRKGFDFVQTFADCFNLSVNNNTVHMPEELGTGFIKEVYLENGLKLCIHRYELKQTFVLKRGASVAQRDGLTIKFDGRRIPIRQHGHPYEPLFSPSSSHAVELATTNFFTELTLPPGQDINLLIMNVSRQTLLNLLGLEKLGHPLHDALANNPSFVFHERMTPDMERIIKQLNLLTDANKLAQLLYLAKAHELIYLLFDKLLNRPDQTTIAVNEAEAQKIYAVRAALLADLSVPPRLADLAREVGMSKTRMTLLFRQIFGDSLLNYFQAARMSEAAKLLTELSVSETGYKLGFSNLSHFTRLFERHHQMKPKRFKDAVSVVQ